MGKHLVKNGFTPNYTRWVHHGEAHRMREEVVRPRVEGFDADAGVADMLDDFHEAQYVEGRMEEEMEATAKAFYDMMESAQKPLHDRTTISQLDAIGHVMGYKFQFSLSREAYDGMLALIASLLPEGHILPKSMYDSQKLLRALMSSRTWGKFATNLFHNAITILHPTPLYLIGTGNFFVNPSINEGNLPRRNVIPFLDRVREMGVPISFVGSKRRYRLI
jgi:hypothetical protein